MKERKINRKKAQKDILRAMENREEVLMEYLSKQEDDKEISPILQTNQQIYELFSEETKEIYRQYLQQNKKETNVFLQQIMENERMKLQEEELVHAVSPDNGMDNAEIVTEEVPSLGTQKEGKIRQSKHLTKEMERQLQEYEQLQSSLFSRNIEEVLHFKEEEKRIHLREDKVTYLHEAMEAKLHQNTETKRFTKERAAHEIKYQRLDFIHKKEESLNQEELLEELMLQKTKNRKVTNTEEFSVSKEQQINKIVQQSIHHTQVERTENIEEIIRQNIKGQLNQLSDQIYGKLEKKLQTERKRRGYY